MRVLAVTDFFHPRQGGIERVVLETARGLRPLGVEVSVLTRRLEEAAPERETIEGIAVHRVGRGPASLPAELTRLFLDVRAFAAEQLAAYDLVHAHLTLTALALLGPIHALRLPLVATYYGPWDREYAAELSDAAVPSRWPRPLRPLVQPAVAALLRRLQQRVLGAAERVVVLSRHSGGEIAEFGYTVRAPIEHVPGGVDVERFRPRDRAEARARAGLGADDGPVLVAVRRLVPRMGLEALVEATASLRGRFPRIVLLLGGSGPLRGRLLEQAAASGLAGRVKVLGAVPETELPWLYAAADVAVLPTRALEGFGLPVLEAWAAGVAVAGTPVGALAETLGLLDPRLVAAGTGATSLASTLGRWLAGERPPEHEVRERARALALSFRWERASERLAAIYRQAQERTQSVKVLLVNTYRDYERYVPESLRRYCQYTATLEDLADPWPPLEWAYVSAALKQAGHDVTFIDAHLEARDFSERELEGFDAVVANTAPYEKWRCTQVFHDHAMDLLRRARKAGARTAVFGPHPTTTPEYFGDADVAIVGEPDPVIVDALEGRRSGVVAAPETPLDDLAYPDFSIFDFARYDSRVFFEGRARGPLGVAMGSRGCPYPCTFCFKALVPDKVRYHDPAVVLRMVEEQRSRGVKALIFEDLTFTMNKKWTLEVCAGLRETGVKYSVMTRVDRIDDDIAEALGSSGCLKVELGVEAGNDEMLKMMRKKAHWEHTLKATRLLRERGVPIVSAFRMVFVPGETPETIDSFVRQCRDLGFDTFPNVCTPYPKTPLWQQGVAEGKIRGDAVHWEDAALAAGTVGTSFDRDDIARTCDRLAMDSHRPYWKSVARYARSHGLGRLARKIAAVSSNRLQRRFSESFPIARLNR